MPKNRVLILEPTTQFDVSGLTRYGEIVYLFNGDRPSIFSPAFTAAVLDRLEALQYTPQRDFIAIAGNMIGTCRLVGTAMAEYGAEPSAKVLGFDRRTTTWSALELIPEEINHDSTKPEALQRDESIPSGNLPILAAVGDASSESV